MVDIVDVQVVDSTEDPGRAADGKWQPGRSGNPLGRPRKENSLASLIKEALDEFHPLEVKLAEQQGRAPRTVAQVICDKLVTRAMMGDEKFLPLFLHYAIGKPKAIVDAKGESDRDHESSAKLSGILQAINDVRKKQQSQLTEGGE